MSEPTVLRFGVAGLISDHVWTMGDGLALLPEVLIVAAADSNEPLRERAARQWGLPATFPDHAAMLDNERLDAILVCSDNASKPGIVETAAARGVHVYQDKPMAATVAGADRILAAVQSSGIIHMTAFHSVFSRNYPRIKDAIQSGAIGTPYLARGIIGHNGPVEYGCSPYFCDWLFDRARNGGGSFVDEACYTIDQFLDVLGPVTEVSGFRSQIGYRDYLPPGVEDNAVAMLRFANGALGLLDAKWGQIGEMPFDTSFHGSNGTLLAGPNGVDLFTTLERELPAPWEPAEPKAPISGAPSAILRGWHLPRVTDADEGAWRGEQRIFVDHLRQGSPIGGPAGVQMSRDVQAVISAVYASMEQHRAISLP